MLETTSCKASPLSPASPVTEQSSARARAWSRFQPGGSRQRHIMAASMTIRELRAALTQHGCDYSACIEKKEMVRMLEHITQSKAEPSAKRQRSAAEGEAALLLSQPTVKKN